MKAIAVNQDTGELEYIDLPEPQIQTPYEVKLKVLEVGVCGTDQEIIEHKIGKAPPGEKMLVLGHEMISEVIEVGSKVTTLKKGDLAIVTVRRGCGKCPFCLKGCFDYCSGIEYIERGIRCLSGFNAEYVVDDEAFIVKAPESFRHFGFLVEPMTISEKAIEELIRIQKGRIPGWSPNGKKAVVIGLGPIGLLACMVLTLRGFKVYGQDIVSNDSIKAKIVHQMGGIYINGKEIRYSDPTLAGQFDVIVEAAGIAAICFQCLDLLAPNGVCAYTGIPNLQTNSPLPAGKIIKRLVLKNQILFGSVNASKHHWEKAIQDLESAEKKWKGIANKMITTRMPYTNFKGAFTRRSQKDIKIVLSWV